MKKRILLICAALVLALTLSTVLALTIAGETETPAAPELTIDFANLSFRNEVCIKYAVSAENAEFVKLLVWTTPQTSYTKGTEDKVLNPVSPEIINGVEYKYVFDYTDLTAKQMTDYVYVVAYTEVDGTAYYSDVVKYSILQYAYNKLGYTGTATTNEKLTKMLKAMLEYGAAAQEYNGYKTETLANADFSQITTENAVLPDGFTFGLYKSGTKVNVTAIVPEDKLLHNWSNNSVKDYKSTTTYQVTAADAKGTNVECKAEFVGKSSGGNFVYEIDRTLSYKDSEKGAMKVDGVMDDAYMVNGVHIPSMYKADNKVGEKVFDNSSFDVYITADSKNVYVYYHFNKNSQVYNPNEYNYPSNWHHVDNVDFCFSADATDAIGKEFHILGGIEGGPGTALVNNASNMTASGITEYYVKHDAEGYGYSVEFAIPLTSITGKDANGNKMFSFTAVGTITYDWPTAGKAPSRCYITAYKAAGAEAKARPSYVVLNGYEQTAATNPTKTDEKGNYIYELARSAADSVLVDGLRDDIYNTNSVHQVAVANFVSSGTTFDVYYTADDTHIYVLYEFVKNEKIFYDANYKSKFHEDCVDFVLDLTGSGSSSGKEFRILAGVEGGKGTAVTDDTLANFGVDDYYVKHTHNGYNVEFSIPLTKVTGKDANGNKMISFTACSTVTHSWDGVNDMGRNYTTANSASGKGGNDAKATPNFLVIKNSQYNYELKETTEKVNYTDGLKDSAYDSGLHFTPKYKGGAGALYSSTTDTFDMYITADAENVYMLWQVIDNDIVSDHADWWKNDCIEILWSTSGAMNNADGKRVDYRVFAYSIGTNKQTSGSGKINLGTGGIKSYTVVKTDVGYNVEIAIQRSAFTNKNVFSFVGMGTFNETSTSAPTYVGTVNGVGAAENPGKDGLSKVTIIPAK